MTLTQQASISLEFLERLLHHSLEGKDYPHRIVTEESLRTCICLIRAFLSSREKEEF